MWLISDSSKVLSLGCVLVLAAVVAACGSSDPAAAPGSPSEVSATVSEVDLSAEPTPNGGSGEATDPEGTAPGGEQSQEPSGEVSAEPGESGTEGQGTGEPTEEPGTGEEPGSESSPEPECTPEDDREIRCADGSLGVTCSCDDEGLWSCAGDGCDGNRCDDGSALTCRIAIPDCGIGEIVAVIDGCYACVNSVTCSRLTDGLPGIGGTCSTDADCRASEQCQRATTPGPPRSECTAHSCETEEAPVCRVARPGCGADGVAVVQDGCWVCVNAATCEPVEGTAVSACATNADCGLGTVCDPCAEGSGDDCVARCVPQDCPSEDALTCRCIEPDCGESAVLVIRDGCWACVDADTCRAIVDADTCG